MKNKVMAIGMALVLALAVSSPADAAKKVNPYVKKWTTFATQTYSGSGDSVLELPKALKAGIIKFTHDGERNFAVWNLNTSLEHNDLLVNTIGEYSGTRTFGLNFMSKKTKALEITADGNWTAVVSPMNSAPKFTGAGAGEGVFKVSLKKKPLWKFSHDGERNFAVWEYCTNGGTDLLVNTIGTYSGKKVGLSGSCIIDVTADGNWSISK